jgi:hypothetical protein
VKKREILCSYQPYIDRAPVAPTAMYGQACSNDQVTVNAWRDTWISQAKANHARLGSFGDRSLGRLWGKYRNLPAIVVGSGPSLKENAQGLKDKPAGIPVLSCLHNFHFLEDLGVGADYYVSLDAGPVTLEEVSEGGAKSPEEYWAMTRGKTLIAYVGSHPDLLSKWQGEVYLFNCPVPDETVLKEIEQLEKFNCFISSGGNVLGACTYIAKAFFGCNPIIFMGADFSFSYLDKFHGWDSKYDKDLGHYIRMVDVYGNTVKTWQSYANFKAWFDWLAESVPGLYINCTEGGTFGAYPQGNIRAVIQMDLADCLRMYRLCEEMREQSENPATDTKKILF